MIMTDAQITALAREYAEEMTKDIPLDNDIKSLRESAIKLNAEGMEKHLRWLLRRFCIVEKHKVIIKYKNAKRLEEDATAFGFERHRSNAIVIKSLIESLFPEIAKEVER